MSWVYEPCSLVAAVLCGMLLRLATNCYNAVSWVPAVTICSNKFSCSDAVSPHARHQFFEARPANFVMLPDNQICLCENKPA